MKKQTPRGVQCKSCSQKFHKIHRKTPMPECLFKKVIGCRLMPATLLKKETLVQVFSCEFCEISNRRTPFLTEHSRQPVAACVYVLSIIRRWQIFSGDCRDYRHSLREIVQIWSFFWSAFSHIRTEYGGIIYRSVFSLNAGKYGPEKLRIWTLSRSDYTGSGRLEAFCKKCPEMFLKHRKQPCANVQKFRKIYTKTPALELHFNKAEVQASNFLKRRLQQIMKNTFLTEHFSVTGSKSFKNNSFYIVPLVAASELFIEYL